MLSTKLKEAAGNGADATLYVDDVFSTYLYTGNGSTQTITNGIDLAGKGGMTWIKSRSAATDHKLTDTTRGATKALISDTTGAETTDTTGLTAFSSTGFSLGASSVYNTTATTYASWTFREAAKFFDVQTVTHTNGTANNINLSALGTVGMVIAKSTTTTGDWTVWQRTLTAGNNMQLNTTTSQSTSNAWLSVSGTTATLAAAAPTDTYVIYAYAHDTSSTGIIQCGSFTVSSGSGNTDVNLGFEPQWMLAKPRSSAFDNWNIYDTMRGWVVRPGVNSNKRLNPNASTQETSDSSFQPTSTGFTMLNSAVYPGAPVTYIYMAIRMPNKPPTSGTQVYNPTFGLSASNSEFVNAGFPIDLNWRGKTTGDNVIVQDRLRAASQFLFSNLTDAETFTSGYVFTTQNGCTFTSTANFSNWINWSFKRAPGFFDEVCYTGTGLAPAVTHNLGVVPELIIQKNRDGGAFGNWFAFNATQYLKINLTDAATTYSSAITSTTFQPVSQSGGTNYIAYLFATLAGISKVGSYTGNGTGQAIACGFSAGARFVLIKRTDSTGDWYTFDSARGLTSGSSPYLLLNSTAAEVTGNNGVYASTGGFTLGATAITTTNIATATYIFLAVA